MKTIKKLNQRGDTIVEVLLAVGIVGLIIAGAYVTANRSTNAERDAQEHSQALTLAQTQIESLHAQSSSNLPSLNGCYDNLNFINQPCYVSPSGQVYTSQPATSYYYTVTLNIVGSASIGSGYTATTVNTYEAVVTWPSLTGGTASVQLYYRPL